MIRASLVLLVLAALAVAALAVAGEPGRASAEWLGWRLEMTGAAEVVSVLVGAFLAVSLWRIAQCVVESSVRDVRARSEQRRRQGAEALTCGFLAAASGVGSGARRRPHRLHRPLAWLGARSWRIVWKPAAGPPPAP